MTQLKSENFPLPSEKLKREAAHWLARLDKLDLFDGKSTPLDDHATQDAEFSVWLNASLSHRVALLRLISVWKRTHRLAVLKSPDVMVPAKGWISFPHVRKIVGLAVAASLLLVLTFTMKSNQDPQADNIYQTVRGAQKIASLEDGSTIVLNSDTKLVVEMSHEERVIILERGEAFFEVAHNENRPFKIVAGDQVVTVLGTKFAVHRRGSGRSGEIEIAVTEGKVQIDILNSRHEESSLPIIRKVISKGDIAKTKQGAILIVHQGLETVARELSWREGFIIFDKMPLSEAAAEFNRYNDTVLIIKDPKIADIRVSGKFKTDNLEAFVRLLTEGFGFHVSRSDEDILISG